MQYKTEELIPIVAKLAEKYTAKESTSITYEKAQQLMGAVIYCICEYEAAQKQSFVQKHLFSEKEYYTENNLFTETKTSFEKREMYSQETEKPSSSHGPCVHITESSVSAMKAYETGAALVEQKVKASLQMYNEMMKSFSDYENVCLYDTAAKGLPEFFKWYDCRFAPQNTILTLDYPVIMDLSPYTGIDRIYEYILCIRIEQRFLKKYPQQFVMEIFEKYSKRYRTMIDNLCEIVLMNICGHILAEKKLDELHFEAEEYQILLEKVGTKSLSEMKIFLKNTVEKMVREYYENDENMIVYLCKAADNIAVRIKNAAENDALQRLF